MTDLGSDISLGPDADGVFDLTDDLATVDGTTAYLQAIGRRLQSEGLFYDPSFGVDLMMFVGGSKPTSVIAQIVEAQALRDERTLSAQFVVTSQTDEELVGELQLATESGTPSLTLTIDRTTGVVLATATDQPRPARVAVPGGG